MARGVAVNNEITRSFLAVCPAVESFSENARDYLDFKYDPKQVPATCPDGVWFRLDEAPF